MRQLHPLPHSRPPHAPMPRSLIALVAVIALIEIVLSLSDAGIIFEPLLMNTLLSANPLPISVAVSAIQIVPYCPNPSPV